MRCKLVGRWSAIAFGGAALVASLAAQGTGITNKDLLEGLTNTSRWLTYSGDYTGRRHSPLTQITPANVGQLTTQWTFQTGYLGNPGPVPTKFESSPIVVDGVIYITGEMDHAWAIDARTGRELWHHQRKLPGPFRGDPGSWDPVVDTATAVRSCCGPVNRGFAVFGDRLYKLTLDMHLLALEMKTGKVIWDVEVDSFRRANAGTGAPLIVKDKIIVANAGGDFASRGFVDAYDFTGKRVWRFWSIPLPGEPGGDTWPSARAAERGGAAGWLTGSYDPELNLVYWPFGNPNPDYDGRNRKGDNLYSNSLVALDPDTGKLKWHFQFTPWDEWDYDSTQTPVLADITFAGQPRKVVMQANRNGFFYVLDRTNGQFLLGKPYVKVTWASGLTAAGRPIETPNNRPTLTGNVVCPNSGTNWFHPSFDPATGFFYVNAREGCRMATNSEAPRPETYEVGERPVSRGKGVPLPRENAGNTGLVLALDPATGERKWEAKYGAAGSWAGVLTTASGLLFTGDNDGHVLALDSRTGKELWRLQLGGSIYAAPATYMIDGRQYVSVASETTFTTFALPVAGRTGSR